MSIEFDLDPEMRAFIARYLEVSANLSTATSVSQQRQSYELICREFCYDHATGIKVSDETVEGRHGPIGLRHYHYQPNPNCAAQIVFLHGGGFILGSLDSHDDICAELCATTGFDVVSIDYRLAPEHLHAVQLDDVHDAFLAIRQQCSILVGVSAGATLSAALCHRLRGSDQMPAAQLLIYPSLGGDRFDLESYRCNANAPLLTTQDIMFYRAARSGERELPFDDAEFYPLVATDFKGLAPTEAFSADIDPLRDDAALYVEKLHQAGVYARSHNETGLTHDYLRARHLSRKAATSFKNICQAITRLSKKA